MRFILISSIHAINNTRVAYAFAVAATAAAAAAAATSVPVSITNIVFIRITWSRTIGRGRARITTRYISKATTVAAVFVAVLAVGARGQIQSAQITVASSVVVN